MLGSTADTLRARLHKWRTVAMVAIVASSTLAPATAMANEPPVLLSFNIVHIFDNYWLLYGELIDESPQSCQVSFGGVLDGYATAPESDGTYSCVVELPPDLVGYVTAIAEDGRSYSNMLEDFLYQ